MYYCAIKKKVLKPLCFGLCRFYWFLSGCGPAHLVVEKKSFSLISYFAFLELLNSICTLCLDTVCQALN